MSQFAILLPVYNGLPYLRRCIESLLAQTRIDFEVWIGDDGSTDGSREYLETLRDPRFQLRNSQRLGLFRNLNSLLQQTQSPYLRVLCQDDALEPECLATEAACFDRQPDLGILFSKGSIIDERGAVVSRDHFGDLPERMPPLLTLQHLYYHGCFPGNLSTVAFRRSAIARIGGFDTRFKVAADYEMWFRIARQNPLGVLHRHLVQVRRHSGQLSVARRSGLRFIIENRQIRASILPLLPEHAQPGARTYERMRHGVLDFHYTIRCLVAGRWITVGRAIRTIGLARWLKAGAWWVWTANNRRYRPQARWILPEHPQWPADERGLQKKIA